MFQEEIQGCLEESRVLGLENTVIVRLGQQFSYESGSPSSVLHTSTNHLIQVGLPQPEVVVDVNYRHAFSSRALCEFTEWRGNRPGSIQCPFGLEFE